MSKQSFTVRANRSLQVNVNSLSGVDEPQEFLEIVVCRLIIRDGCLASKTKKFYDSPSMNACRLGNYSAIPDFSETAVGKAYNYVNRLLYGKWITEVEYDAVWSALSKIEEAYYRPSWCPTGQMMKYVPWWN